DVQDPQAAAVSGRHDLPSGWVDGKVVHGHGRQIIVDLGPVVAAVARYPNRELGADEKQIAVLDILAQTARGAPGKIALERSPCFAEVLGHIDKGAIIVLAMAVERHVGPAFDKARWLDRRNAA